MRVATTILINAKVSDVYKVFSEINKAEARIPGITKLEILSDKKSGIGMRWRETRVMFGKEATEEMQMTDAKNDEFYTVEADSRGTHYTSTYTFTKEGKGTRVDLTFDSDPYSLGSKMMLPLAWTFKGTVKKMLLADMQALKEVIES